jgi:phage-related holin
MNDIWSFLLSLVNVKEIAMLTSLLIGNMITGALAGAVTGTFDWSKLSDIWKRVAGIFAAYLVVSTLAQSLINMGYGSNWDIIRTGITVYLSAKLINYILANLAEMGIPIPSSLNKFPVVKQLIGILGIGASVPGRLLTKKTKS